jgi:hypothetical protein
MVEFMIKIVDPSRKRMTFRDNLSFLTPNPECSFPRRKSKFLKMLKNYTGARPKRLLDNESE